MNLIIEQLEAQIAPAKAELVQSWLRRADGRAARVRDLAVGGELKRHRDWYRRRNGSELEREFNPYESRGATERERVRRDAYEHDLAELFFSGDGGVTGVVEYARIPESDLQELARKYADAVWADYISKMSKKFENIRAEGVTVEGLNPLQNVLHVQGANGVTFDLESSVVEKESPRGVWFCQFPARVRNVLRDGVPIKHHASLAGVIELTR
jgi:hypothetical protein